MEQEKGLGLSGIEAQIGFLRHDLFDIIDALMPHGTQSVALKTLVIRATEYRIGYIRRLVNGAFDGCNAQATVTKKRK